MGKWDFRVAGLASSALLRTRWENLQVVGFLQQEVRIITQNEGKGVEFLCQETHLGWVNTTLDNL